MAHFRPRRKRGVDKAMAGATEIYICKEDERLEDSSLEYSNMIHDREEAEADARALCRHDPRIRKIAYYAVSEKGPFRRLLTFENPNFVPKPSKQTPVAPKADLTAERLRRKREEASLWTRVVNIFSEDDLRLEPDDRR